MALALFLAACQGSSKIKEGSVVSVHYTLTVDGQVVDASREGAPLQYTQGPGQIIPGLEEQLVGHSAGEKMTVQVTPEKGYGVYTKEAIQKVPRKQFAKAKDLKVGTMVTSQSGGRLIQAKVTAIDKKNVTLDLNHPLAGKTLNFDIEIVSVGASAPASVQ